jgi:hypothetical protein
MNSHQRGTFVRNDTADLARIGALLADLQRSLEIIKAEIEIEEGRSEWRSPTDPRYPPLGRALRARRDNLVGTIRVLEDRAKVMIAPADAAVAA